MKLRNKISKGSLVVITLILIALFYGLSSRSAGRLAWHQQIVISILLPFQKSINFIGDSVSGAWNHYFALVGASKENDRLYRVINEQDLKFKELAEIEAENIRLRKLLDFKSRHSLGGVGAKIVASDPRGDFKLLTADRGLSDGVEPDMPVVAASGLVGRVADVGNDIARVLLITDPNNAVDVMVQRSRARALLVGATASADLRPSYSLSRLEYLENRSDIKNGDVLVTSGLDGLYPSGIPVGTVEGLKSGSLGVFKSAEVIPFVDFGQLEEIVIVKR